MQLFLLKTRFFRSVLACAILLSTTNVSVLAQDGEDSPVQNVRKERQGKINIFIEYDLEGSSEDVYTVTFMVKSKSDSLSPYIPVNVIGDIGANIRPGKNKRISWRTSDEYPAVLDASDVEFVIKAELPPSEGGNTELFIAGGAAVVGVALAIVLLSSNKADPTQTNNVFPQPPGRP
jgi:hypothetical protein